MWRAALLVLAGAAFASPSALHAQTNGLTPKERTLWYHLSQGTEFLPYDFFMALKDFKTGRMLSESFPEFGFLEDPGPHNAAQLPVGVTLDETRDLRFAGVKMIGLNCAACHTAEPTRNGKPVRIDGATALVNVNGFSTRVGDSIQQTLTDAGEFLAFARRVIQRKTPSGAFALAQAVQERILADFQELVVQDERIVGRLKKLLDRRFDEAPALDVSKVIVDKTAAGTVDAIAARTKQLDDESQKLMAPSEFAAEILALAPRPALLTRLGVRHNASLRSTIAEIIVIHRLLRARFETFRQAKADIKTVPGYGRVDAFGTARNKLFPEHAQPLDAPVRFPFLWEIPVVQWFHWDGNTRSALERNVGEALGVGVIVDSKTGESTIRLDNLIALEAYAAKLQPPRWPVDVFGAIDNQKAAAGKLLFQKRCLTCHEDVAPGAIVKDTILELKKVGTDALRVTNIRRKVGGDGFFDAIAPRLKQVIEAAEGAAGDPAVNHWRPSTANQPDLPLGYPNRPLRSIWASPPYLHNGSAPTVYDLLLPAEKRPVRFRLGSREYDTAKLGYVEDDRATFEFDVTKPGNSNQGHDYNNAQFTDEQRFELIEYLKTR